LLSHGGGRKGNKSRGAKSKIAKRHDNSQKIYDIR
jgi:hypothetical protein